MNDDGFLDMILANDNETVIVFGPPIAGTWSLEDASPAYDAATTFSGVGDVNADGRDDLLVGNGEGAFLFLQ
jgi:hypothetical protein